MVAPFARWHAVTPVIGLGPFFISIGNTMAGGLDEGLVLGMGDRVAAHPIRVVQLERLSVAVFSVKSQVILSLETPQPEVTGRHVAPLGVG